MLFITPDDIITYTEFKAVQDRSSNKLNDDILQAQTDVFTIVGHKFASATYLKQATEQPVAIVEGTKYKLGKRRVSDVTFKRDGVAIPAEQIKSLENTAGYVTFTEAQTGSITATFKYIDLRDEVELAIKKLAEYFALINTDDSIVKGITSESMGNYSYSYGARGKTKPDVSTLLLDDITHETAPNSKKTFFRMRGV